MEFHLFRNQTLLRQLNIFSVRPCMSQYKHVLMPNRDVISRGATTLMQEKKNVYVSMSQCEEESRGHVDWSLLQWSHSTWEVMSNGVLIKWSHSTWRGRGGGLSPPARSNGKSDGKTHPSEVEWDMQKAKPLGCLRVLGCCMAIPRCGDIPGKVAKPNESWII